MQAQDLQDLIEGRNEWCNIPAPVRASIRIFNEIIQSQARHIHHLDAQLKDYADRQDNYNSITQGALDEMLESFSDFSSYTQESMNKFTTKVELERVLNEVRKNIDIKIAQVNNQLIDGSQLASKVESSLFTKEIERLDNAITNKDHWMEEQRVSNESRFVHTDASISQLENSTQVLVHDMAQLSEALQGKASKSAVSVALKKRVSHEELDAAVQQIIEEVNGLIKRHAEDSEDKWKRTVEKLESTASFSRSTVPETSASVVLLERQISKNFAEINRMVLDLDMKPDRSELQQLEDSLESHFKLISGISQEIVDLKHALEKTSHTSSSEQEGQQLALQRYEAVVDVQQVTFSRLNKSLADLQRALCNKPDHIDVDRKIANKAGIEQVEWLAKALEERPTIKDLDHALSKHSHHQRISPSSEQYDEIAKALESKADRDEVARVSKMIIELESSMQWHMEEEERRGAAVVRSVRMEVERSARAEVERGVHAEVEAQVNAALSRRESEWREERAEELAVKANLAELHQVRKETTDLASRILALSRDLHDTQASIPRRLETLLAARDAHAPASALSLGVDALGSASVLKEKEKEKDFQWHVALEQLRDEVEQVKARLKKKAERAELQDVLKALSDTPPHPHGHGGQKGDALSVPKTPKGCVTREELDEVLKQKVDFVEFMASLSLKLDHNELQVILAREYSLSPAGSNVKGAKPNSAVDSPDMKTWMDHILTQLEQCLHNKVDINEFIELKEQLQKKLDIAVFLQAQSEITENARKLDRDLRALFHSVRTSPTGNLTLVHTISPKKSHPPPSFFSHNLPATSARLSSSTHAHHVEGLSIPPHKLPDDPSLSTPTPPTHENNHLNGNYLPLTSTSISPPLSGGGRWFKDVKPPRYLEILKELNSMKSVKGEKSPVQ